jgi:hypothetical protein
MAWIACSIAPPDSADLMRHSGQAMTYRPSTARTSGGQ